jgi:hypothetical protein
LIHKIGLFSVLIMFCYARKIRIFNVKINILASTKLENKRQMLIFNFIKSLIANNLDVIDGLSSI